MNTIQAAHWLINHDDYLILTHRSPDGDTIGSAAGLCLALREQGKTAYVLENEDISDRFLPFFEGITMKDDGFVPKTIVAVDIAATSLIPDNAKDYEIDLTIDHHPSQEYFAKETLVEPDKAATGEIIYHIVDRWTAVSKEVALPLYLAVSTDTGCFVYGNTTGDTHRVAGVLMDTGLDIRTINHTHFR
ncbi:MAG: DHH family phosphoesterase, partial [Eubacteriales bacterium]